MNKQLWIEEAKQQGFESFEIYQSDQSSKEITWFNGQVDTFVTSHVLGTSIRGVYQGNMANMALESVDDSRVKEIISSLKQQATHVTSEDQDTLRHPEQTELVSSNRKWIVPSVEAVKELLAGLEKDLMAYDSRIVQVASLGWSESSGTRDITNSYGLHVQDEDHVQYLMASVVVQENGVVKDDYLIRVIENIEAFDQKAFVEELCTKALFKLGARSLPSQTCPVIFERHAMTSLLSSFMSLFDGELIYRGISPLKDKLNTKIFSDQITIVDDPKNVEALSIANFDDEGCPTKRKVLVENGKFVSMLHDTKSASRMNTTSTGNGFKSGYASSVSVQPMNCQILPGTTSLEDMEQNMGDGFVIESLQGLHAGIDFVTTNFSLQCNGYWVKDGKKERAVSLVTVAGNFLDLMKSVVEVGSDLDWEYHVIVSPSIRFESCSISGE